jgi:hypothetical protein
MCVRRFTQKRTQKMEVIVKRVVGKKSTIGDFFIDGKFMCKTLEDPCRFGSAPRPYGNTAIPFGKYWIKYRREGNIYASYCTRFADIKNDRGMLHIFNKPDEKYDFWYPDRPSAGVAPGDCVMIHVLNTPDETLGCLGVGMAAGTDSIIDSTVAYRMIYPIIAGALDRGEEVTIEYIQ